MFMMLLGQRHFALSFLLLIFKLLDQSAVAMMIKWGKRAQLCCLQSIQHVPRCPWMILSGADKVGRNSTDVCLSNLANPPQINPSTKNLK